MTVASIRPLRARVSTSKAGTPASRRHRLSHGLMIALALAGPAWVCAADAAGTSLLSRAMQDPRWRGVSQLDLAGRAALAREYRVEALLPGSPMGGTVLPVLTCDDDGPGSLRLSIELAASGDTVDARALQCSTITLTSGQITSAAHDLTILGPGKNRLTVANGYGTKYDNRLLMHSGSGNLTITGMTFAGGVTTSVNSTSGNARGGCIYSGGTVILGNFLFPEDRTQGVVVRDCRAIASSPDRNAIGGAIYAPVGLSMTNSVISGSEASGASAGQYSYGGGVFTHADVTMKYSELRDNEATGVRGVGGGLVVMGDSRTRQYFFASTFAGNSASTKDGAAYLAALYGDTRIHNSTLSGNTAPTFAGLHVKQLAQATGMSIFNTTITGNVQTSASAGAGLFIDGVSATNLQSTIISGNFRSTSSPDNVSVSAGTPLPDGADNLIGSSTIPVPADTISLNSPQLRALARNGGPTRTHALLASSPARDAGNNGAPETTDQRGVGYPRVVGAAADIGAYEYDPDRIFHDGFDR